MAPGRASRLQIFWPRISKSSPFFPNFSKESFGGFVGFQRLAIAEGPVSNSPNFCGSAGGRLRAEASQEASEIVVRIGMVCSVAQFLNF
jgi:hypothetical protein